VKRHDGTQLNRLPHRSEAVNAQDGGKAVKEIRLGYNPFMVDTMIGEIHVPNVNKMKAIALSNRFHQKVCSSHRQVG
jgi:hypothetical protein